MQDWSAHGAGAYAAGEHKISVSEVEGMSRIEKEGEKREEDYGPEGPAGVP